MRQAKLKVIDIKSFAGLELETDDLARTPNSWQVLENFDQFRSGAIRRVRGMEPLATVTYDKPISAITRYRRSETDPAIVIGLDGTGVLHNLQTGADLAVFDTPTNLPPFLGAMTGINNGDTIKYLVAVGGGVPQKWDGAGSVTRVGITPPAECAHVTPVIATVGAPGSDSFIPLLVSRRYLFTFWNPTTRHESSPSSVLYPPATTGLPPPGIQPAPDGSVITQVLMKTRGDNFVNLLAQGYTRIRWYATRDGGEVFYLLTGVQFTADTASGVWVTEDADNSLPIEAGQPNALYIDGVNSSNPDSGTGPNTPPALDASLVQPAPDPGENDPPPESVWAAIYQGRLFLVPKDAQDRLVFSNLESFESFAPDNRFTLESSQYDPIIALDGQANALIVGKSTSTSMLTGVDFTDFVMTPLDPQINFVGRRALVHAGGVMYFFSRQGIMAIQGMQPVFYGKVIRPLTDTIVSSQNVIMTQDSLRGYALMYAELPNDKNVIIIADYSQASPFSTMVLPHHVTAMEEVELPENEPEDSDEHSTVVLVALADGVVYELFETDKMAGQQIVARAVTQLLPQDELQHRKIFRRLRVTETPPGLLYRASVDGGRYVKDFAPVRQMAPIGLTGLQLTLEFKHATPIPEGQEVVLSNFLVEYVVLGEARDYGS